MRSRGTVVWLFALLLSACDSMELPEASYSSRSEVVQDGAVARGWVPAWLPSTAKDLRERHDLDNNISQLTFAFETLGSTDLSQNCTRVDPSAATMPRKILVDWWPADLRSAKPLSRFSFYACSDAGSTAYLAIDDEQKRAYFWRP